MRLLQKMKALLCLLVFLCAGNGVCLAEDAFASVPVHTPFVYGQSELGRSLICHRVGSADADKSILIIFGVHGFEDAFDHDGEVLKMIAENVITHFGQKAEDLQNFCLYIVPSANPDGLMDGTTKDGYGRCNANGLDINRDFPFDWAENTSTRNQTGKAPFSTAEARAIRDLVDMTNPTFGIDVHGWKNASYGNGKMAETFARSFRFGVKRLSTEGMLGAWLNSITEEGMMLELPASPNKEEYVIENSARLIEGINAWVEHCRSGS